MEPGYFFNFEKFAYVKNIPTDGCILCGIRDNNPDIINLTIAQSTYFLACINLYPFNPGHLLVFPKRHILDLREYEAPEVIDHHKITCILLDILKTSQAPAGFNIGYNMGTSAGASIPHIHQHIIPRYPREIGMAELIGGQRVMVEDPRTSAERLRTLISRDGRLSVPD